jgi:glycerol uptake facilitator-like aquaporin
MTTTPRVARRPAASARAATHNDQQSLVNRVALSLGRRLAGEFLGSAVLLAAVVGSGIMGERLSGGNVAIALLANSIATGAVLVCLILALGPISGAHLNPAVSIADALFGGLKPRECIGYILAQIAGAIAGVLVAHAMFGLPAVSLSHHVRSGPSQWFAEFVATSGLLLVIWGCVRCRSAHTAFAVAAYIVGAYWFTASTSFANPAVTIARSLTDTFAGIRPIDAPAFIAAQLLGAIGMTVLFVRLYPMDPRLA